MFKTDFIFARGELNIIQDEMDGADHISRGEGVEIDVKDMDKGVKWLGFQWSPMLAKSTVKNQLEKIVHEAIGQLKEVEVSAESTLYLCDLVVWGKMNYKAYLGSLRRTEMDELEKGVRHCYLKAAKLPKFVSMKAVSLPANVGGLGWLPWYDRLMKNRVATINKWIGTETSIGYNIFYDGRWRRYKTVWQQRYL